MKTKIKANIFCGKEKTVNGTLHFGMGLYIYSEDAAAIGYNGALSLNPLFVVVQEKDLDFILDGLEKKDGYLAID